MKHSYTPLEVEAAAARFSGQLINTLDLLSRSKTFICKATQANKPDWNAPTEFVKNVMAVLPKNSSKALAKVFPDCTILKQPEMVKAIGADGEYYWFDFIVYARYGVTPSKPEKLEPIFHAYCIIGYSPSKHRLGVEIIDSIVTARHLLISEPTDRFDTFSASVVYYIVDEEVLPRLAAALLDNNDISPAFAVGSSAIHNCDGRAIMISLPTQG